MWAQTRLFTVIFKFKFGLALYDSLIRPSHGACHIQSISLRVVESS
jgi:hypothetical protein